MNNIQSPREISYCILLQFQSNFIFFNLLASSMLISEKNNLLLFSLPKFCDAFWIKWSHLNKETFMLKITGSLLTSALAFYLVLNKRLLLLVCYELVIASRLVCPIFLLVQFCCFYGLQLGHLVFGMDEASITCQEGYNTAIS